VIFLEEAPCLVFVLACRTRLADRKRNDIGGRNRVNVGIKKDGDREEVVGSINDG